MAWTLLAAGIILLLTGLIFRFLILKNKSTGEIKGEPVDIYQNSATSSRQANKKAGAGIDRTVASKYKSYKSGNKNTENKNKNITRNQREEKRWVKNHQSLSEINDELEDLIAEINERERVLKEKVQGIDSNMLMRSKNTNFNKTFNQQYQNIQDRSLPDHYKQVIGFHQEGLEIEEIAERLNLGVRETELIVKMHGNGADVDAG